jgi:nicotinate dehydrogenase subunit B
MRTGHSKDHGSASGPMAEVISALAPLPDSDIRAMATYLASLKPEVTEDATRSQVAAAIAQGEDARQNAEMTAPAGARIFAVACASCHSASTALPSLALNTNLHSDTPDNVLQAMLHGVEAPAIVASAEMPSFSESLNDNQLKDLASYLRARFAPDKPSWGDVDGALQRAKSAGHP